MPASFEGAIRKVQYKKSRNADCLIPVPPFWSLYVEVHCKKGCPEQVVVSMSEDGALTIKPYWGEPEGTAP